MRKLSLHDGADVFDVVVLEAPHPAATVLFAVGAGGSPERHLGLLEALCESGCTIAAPTFERWTNPVPNEGALLLRARRLRLALEELSQLSPAHLPTTGIGHSIGATMLLALVGGQAWMRGGIKLEIPPHPRLRRLTLMAPATGFFGAPGALDAVNVPIQLWAGTKDVVTPPAQAELVYHALTHRLPVDLHIVEDADHFSFMNVRPPQSAESLPDRQSFLALLAAEIIAFVASSRPRSVTA